MSNEEEELKRELKLKKIDVITITDTKKKLKGTKEFEDNLMIYSDLPQNKTATCGVTIMVCQRDVTVRLKIDRGHLTVIEVYAPEEETWKIR